MKSIVVYQAYGRPDILEQNLFSVISLFKRHRDFSQVEKILIYTDDEAFFQNHLGSHPRIQYQPMGAERLLAWRGGIEFIHRVKIEMLKDAAQKFPDFNLFYLDGDTYFTKDPNYLLAQVDAHHSIMHEAENIINKGKDPLSKKVARFLKKFDFIIEGKKIKIHPQITMWNAGVLGFAPSFFSSLPKVLEFTDQAYTKYKKHVMEQLAFSYFLASQTRIHAAGEYIHHYWRQKDEYGNLIHLFLQENKNLEQSLTAFEHISWPLPPPPKKRFFRHVLQKIFKTT